jgi:hypothetical protein
MVTKEIALIVAIFAVIVGATAYWNWFQDKEYKSLLKRLSINKIIKSPITLLALIWAFILGNDKNNS